MRKEQNRKPCQYEHNHNPDCSGFGSTKDHMTPRSIMKLWWDKKEQGKPGNIQWLSPECHVDKDRDTPLRLEVLRKQLNGEFKEMTLEMHKTIFEKKRIPKEYLIFKK